MATIEKSRPQPLNTSRSFSRYEPSRSKTPTRTRASTLTNEILSPIAEPLGQETSSPDIFDNEEAKDQPELREQEPGISEPQEDLPEGFDELPIELTSLTDRHALISILTSNANVESASSPL